MMSWAALFTTWTGAAMPISLAIACASCSNVWGIGYLCLVWGILARAATALGRGGLPHWRPSGVSLTYLRHLGRKLFLHPGHVGFEHFDFVFGVLQFRAS